MKKNNLILCMLLLLFAACNDDNREDETELPNATEQLIEKHSHKGVVRIKVSEDFIDSFSPVVTRSGAVTTGLPDLDNAAQALGVTSMKRTYPFNRKYDVRHRKAGLHLWYDVTFDESNPTTRALSGFGNIEGIELVEPVRQIIRVGNVGEPVVLTDAMKQDFATRSAPTAPSKYNNYYNDYYLDFQWHYNNEGFLSGSKTGADINLFSAWDIETGKPDVIVAVVDGGIQYDHPDLLANMWVNEAEMNGAAGVDDDGNGYVDDIYGYNFVTSEGAITAHYHGTHVAGTVGAVNNNGIGVAGVAGGNGSPNSGVRMMSCQIFAIIGGYEYSSYNPASSMIYAADNGAVISQNSWGYTWEGINHSLAAADKAAIDYFINYAGTDESGDNQIGPMKGGIVIFASGNNNISGVAMPGAYEKVMAVSAIGPDYLKASYSNFGGWVDICAPGGEESIEYPYGLVFSTYPGNELSFMAGTSMACPHVSGVAALVVSKYGGQGFTNDKLWNRLMTGTNPINRFETRYNIGVGYLNAQKALAEQNGIAPDRVYDLAVGQSTFEHVELTWSITPDSDNGLPERYEVVYSTSPIYRVNPVNLPSGAGLARFRVSEGMISGNKMRASVTGLTAGRNYYFAVSGVDRDGNYSASSTVYGGSLAANKPPVVEGLPNVISLKRADKTTITLNIFDPEGYEWTHTFDSGSAALSGERVSKTNNFILTFDAYAENPGFYKATLIVSDAQGTKNSLEIPYTIQINHAPSLIQSFNEVILNNIGVEKNLKLSEYFSDLDGDELTYSTNSSNPSVISTSAASGILRVLPLAYGSAVVTVTATDASNDKTNASFNVICRNPNQSIDLYPVPVKSDGVLNIRMGEEVKGNITVSLYNSSGARVFSKETAIAPEAPAKVDISSLSAGSYRVMVKYKINEYSKNITKL